MKHRIIASKVYFPIEADLSLSLSLSKMLEQHTLPAFDNALDILRKRIARAFRGYMRTTIRQFRFESLICLGNETRNAQFRCGDVSEDRHANQFNK